MEYNIDGVTWYGGRFDGKDFCGEDCKSLISVVVPGSVTKIGWGAFSDCSSLKKIFRRNKKGMGKNRNGKQQRMVV